LYINKSNYRPNGNIVATWNLKKFKKNRKSEKQANQMKYIGYVFNKKQENLRMLSIQKEEQKIEKKKRKNKLQKIKISDFCFNICIGKLNMHEHEAHIFSLPAKD